MHLSGEQLRKKRNKTHTSGGTEGILYSFSELPCDSKGGVVLMSSSSSPPKKMRLHRLSAPFLSFLSAPKNFHTKKSGEITMFFAE